MKDYSRNITLYCPVCGNDQFESLDVDDGDELKAPDTIRIKCDDCKAIYTKAELIDSNNERIEANINEMEKEVIKDFEKKLKKMFK